jgi:hypothetical protein
LRQRELEGESAVLWAKYPVAAVAVMREVRGRMHAPSYKLFNAKGEEIKLREVLVKTLRAHDKAVRRESFLAGGLRMEVG